MKLLLFICAALGAASGVSGATGGAMMNMAMITELDVVCDKAGMTVTVDFSQPFNGIIFSKGHYSNPACRYVEENSGQASFTLRISSSECGSLMGQVRGDSTRTQLSNTIIVQNDKYIQEIWDVARTISCDWVDNYVKTVNFNPFSVGMLQTQEVRFQGDEPIECWMDLQYGKYPDVSDITSIVKIGDTLSLLLYARDNDHQYDVSVKDCYAFAGPDFDDPNTPRLQLTDFDGCVIKDKLISQFFSAREDDALGSTIVSYAFVQAFKFPDVMDVFMTCNVEICKGDCDSKCGGAVSTTQAPRRSGSTLFGEPIYTTKPTPVCHPGSTDPECASPCTPNSLDPRCSVPTEKPKCYPGSKDPECSPPKTGKQLFPEEITTQKPRCFPGSKDPSCRFDDPAPIVTTTTLRCYKGSRDPRCPQPPTTTLPPTTKLKCYRGSKDPRCPQIKTTPEPFRCYEGSTHPACTTTTIVPTTTESKCFPGSLDPDCEPVTKDGRYGSILFPATITTTPPTTTTPYKPITVPITVPPKRPSGGILFSDPLSTPRPTPPRPVLKPKTTTTKSPGRGKQLNSEPRAKPEPTGKEWEGESRYHAFHSFHYQRGDGRRSRTFGQRLVPKTRGRRTARSALNEDNPRPFVGKLPLKLSHALHVAAPEEVPFRKFEVAEFLMEDTSNNSTGYICLSSTSATGLVIMFTLLFIAAVCLLFVCIRQRVQLSDKKADH